MNLLQQKFKALAGKKALIPFITAGHPKPEMTVPIMHELVKNGADILELGMPFSDPMADGPVIQMASEQAIKQGVGIYDTIEMVKMFRSNDQQTPIILMGYLNPVECMGNQNFVEQAKTAGVNGLLLVDSPPEESEDLLANLKQQDMDQIFLVAPTTTEARKKMICQHASGFVYYVALKGVTGSADLDCEAVNVDVQKISNHTELPIAVGFGVKDADSAVSVAGQADAVVIGSALVTILNSCETLESAKDAIAKFIKPIRTALDSL